MRQPFSPVLAFMLACLCFGCDRREDAEVYSHQFMAMGTEVTINIADVSQVTARQASQETSTMIKNMGQRWWSWGNGELGQINQKLEHQTCVHVTDATASMLELGRRLSLESEGYFNPAIGRLVHLWGFDQIEISIPKKPPDDKAIGAYLPVPGMGDVEIDNGELCAPQGLWFDVGAYAKGHIVDLAIEQLRDQGIKHAIVNAGGDLRVIGKHFDRPWRIAIRNPRGEGIIGMLELHEGESIFTSGDYERKFEYKGKRYHHILDPTTGYPVETSRSVTVVHDDGVSADAAATALFVAGTDKWQQIARKMGIRYILLIDQDGFIRMNLAMAQRIELDPVWESMVEVVGNDPQ